MQSNNAAAVMCLTNVWTQFVDRSFSVLAEMTLVHIIINMATADRRAKLRPGKGLAYYDEPSTFQKLRCHLRTMSRTTDDADFPCALSAILDRPNTWRLTELQYHLCSPANTPSCTHSTPCAASRRRAVASGQTNLLSSSFT